MKYSTAEFFRERLPQAANFDAAKSFRGAFFGRLRVANRPHFSGESRLSRVYRPIVATYYAARTYDDSSIRAFLPLAVILDAKFISWKQRNFSFVIYLAQRLRSVTNVGARKSIFIFRSLRFFRRSRREKSVCRIASTREIERACVDNFRRRSRSNYSRCNNFKNGVETIVRIKISKKSKNCT
jgi:hypothetical protein